MLSRNAQSIIRSVGIGAIAGAIGGLLFAVGHNIWSNFGRLLGSEEVIGAAIGAAIPITISLLLARIERRKNRAAAIRQSLVTIRSLRDAIQNLKGLTPQSANAAWTEVKKARQRIADQIAANTITDVELRLSLAEAYRASGEAEPILHFGVQEIQGLASMHPPGPTLDEDADRCITELEEIMARYRASRAVERE